MVKTAKGTITIEIYCQGVNFSTPKDMEEFAKIMIKEHLNPDTGKFNALAKMNTLKFRHDK